MSGIAKCSICHVDTNHLQLNHHFYGDAGIELGNIVSHNLTACNLQLNKKDNGIFWIKGTEHFSHGELALALTGDLKKPLSITHDIEILDHNGQDPWEIRIKTRPLTEILALEAQAMGQDAQSLMQNAMAINEQYWKHRTQDDPDHPFYRELQPKSPELMDVVGIQSRDLQRYVQTSANLPEVGVDSAVGRGFYGERAAGAKADTCAEKNLQEITIDWQQISVGRTDPQDYRITQLAIDCHILELVRPYANQIVALKAPSYYFTEDTGFCAPGVHLEGAYRFEDIPWSFAYIAIEGENSIPPLLQKLHDHFMLLTGRLPGISCATMYVHFFEKPGAVSSQTIICENTIKAHGPLRIRPVTPSEISRISAAVKEGLASFGTFPDPNKKIHNLNKTLSL